MDKKGISKTNGKYYKYYENKIKNINVDYSLTTNKSAVKGDILTTKVSVIRVIAFFTKEGNRGVTLEESSEVQNALSTDVDPIELRCTIMGKSDDTPSLGLGVVVVVKYTDLGQLLENIKMVVDTTDRLLKLEQLELCSGTAIQLRK